MTLFLLFISQSKVMAFFKDGADYLLRTMADLIGPVLADDEQDPNKVDPNWIPKQNLPPKPKQQATVVCPYSPSKILVMDKIKNNFFDGL